MRTSPRLLPPLSRSTLPTHSPIPHYPPTSLCTPPVSRPAPLDTHTPPPLPAWPPLLLPQPAYSLLPRRLSPPSISVCTRSAGLASCPRSLLPPPFPRLRPPSICCFRPVAAPPANAERPTHHLTQLVPISHHPCTSPPPILPSLTPTRTHTRSNHPRPPTHMPPVLSHSPTIHYQAARPGLIPLPTPHPGHSSPPALGPPAARNASPAANDVPCSRACSHRPLLRALLLLRFSALILPMHRRPIR